MLLSMIGIIIVCVGLLYVAWDAAHCDKRITAYEVSCAKIIKNITCNSAERMLWEHELCSPDYEFKPIGVIFNETGN